MQIRCNRCHKPYALSREAVYAALNLVMEQNLNHYNAPCPHCRRVNRISRQELQRAAPNWEKESAEEAGAEAQDEYK